MKINMKSREEQLRESLALTKTGYAGMNKEGQKVDRRIDPSAVPYQYNPSLNIPYPKQVVKCSECEWIGGEEDLLVISFRNGGDENACPNCKTNKFIVEL